MDITVAPLLDDQYVSDLYRGRFSFIRVIMAYISRVRWLLRVRDYDLIWLEKEMFPWLLSVIEDVIIPSGIPMVVDYDDAVFHRYDLHKSLLVRMLLGKKIDAVMRRADAVVAGNEYIAKRALDAGARSVKYLPTVVDIEKYTQPHQQPNSPLTIGWIGSPNTAKYLEIIAPVLNNLDKRYNIIIVAVGPNPEQLNSLPIEIHRWSEDTEVQEIQKFDIGIMPLPDEPFERGKCGYKIIQYMACGKPVVASPVGVNNKIIQHEVNGYLASTMEEWEKYLSVLFDDSNLRMRMGLAGRKLVESEYSLQVAAPILSEYLRSVI
jgi:glycosyltransferase involved in cell wall biosynthesis